MMKISRYLALALLILQPLFVSAEEGATCDEFTAPFTSVADFDGNGIVNGKDIAMLAKHMGKKKGFKSKDRGKNKSFRSNHRSRHHRADIVYSPLFDRNGDGEINIIDMFKATRDMSKSSSQTDQELVVAYNEFITGTYACADTVEETVEVEAIPAVEEPVVEEPVDYNY